MQLKGEPTKLIGIFRISVFQVSANLKVLESNNTLTFDVAAKDSPLHQQHSCNT
jgi:hypothetical protein